MKTQKAALVFCILLALSGLFCFAYWAYSASTKPRVLTSLSASERQMLAEEILLTSDSETISKAEYADSTLRVELTGFDTPEDALASFGFENDYTDIPAAENAFQYSYQTIDGQSVSACRVDAAEEYGNEILFVIYIYPLDGKYKVTAEKGYVQNPEIRMMFD